MTPRPGDLLPPVEIEVAAEPMKVMALLLRDSNTIHFDPTTVERLGLGSRPVNQGPTNLGYVISIVAAWAGGDDRIRTYDARFLANVFAGDTVVAAGVVDDVDHRPNETIIRCTIWLDLADGARALEGHAVVALPT